MKGGLEALAALCGGARKADASVPVPIESSTDSPNSQPATPNNDTMKILSGIPSLRNHSTGEVAQNSGLSTLTPGVPGTNGPTTETASLPTSSTDSQTWFHNVSQTNAYTPSFPNVAAILSAAGSMLPQQSIPNASSHFSSTDVSNGVQQHPYLNLVKNQPSSTNQIMQPQIQNLSQSPAQFAIDPNAAMAILLAMQQQTQQSQQTRQSQQVQQVQMPQQTQNSEQAQQIQQVQHAQNTMSNGSNNGIYAQGPQTEHNNVQQCTQFHQIKPTSSPKSEVLTAGECLKQPPALYNFARSTTDCSSTGGVGMQPATSLTQSGDEGQHRTLPSSGSQANVSTSNINGSSNFSTQSHQPILMKRPLGGENGRVATSSSTKAPPRSMSIKNEDTADGNDMDNSLLGPEEKKQLKRAANRRSAQLSRKRKKQFIEELNRENDELRRKEQILRSIPDLVLVFDSAGKLWFVSHSVNHFLKYTPTDLEGTSLWNILCDESVRLLKSAFMDALAARTVDSETTPLGSGVWELRMIDKDGTHKWVVLNGVVHFSGDAPECVCSIRPRDRPMSSSQKPSLLRNILERRESKVQNICDSQTGCRTSHQNVQPSARIIASKGHSVQISDSSSIISEGNSDQ